MYTELPGQGKLLVGATGALVPGEVSSVALGAGRLHWRILQLECPLVLLAEGDGSLLRGERHLKDVHLLLNESH